MSRPTPSPLALGLVGLAATFVGIGLGRFSFTPLIPLLVAENVATSAQAAYAAAAMMVGYTVGAIGAAPLARRLGSAPMLRVALAGTALALLAEAFPIGIAGHGLARFVTGVLGAVLMVLGPALALRAAPPDGRGRVAGLTYTGIGLGIVGSGLAVPALGDWGGVTAAALGLAVAALAFGGSAWFRLPPSAPPATGVDGARLSRPVVLLGAAYALDAFGYVPHTTFWSDFIASELGRGVSAGGLHWALFGIGALLGPVVLGRLAVSYGFRRVLTGGLAVKAAAVALPMVSVTPLALGLSSVLVGALVPGMVAAVSGRLSEIVPADRLPARWGLLTAVFAVAQAASGWAHSALYGASGTYSTLFPLAAGALAIATVLVFVSGEPDQ